MSDEKIIETLKRIFILINDIILELESRRALDGRD